MLGVKSLNQFYGESHTLWDIDIEVEKGACLCVLGRNGVGKTTLMECLMGLLPLSSGKILFNGQDITWLDAHGRAPSGIAYVPQGRQIFPLLTVEENLRTGLIARKKQRNGIPGYIYDLFPVLRDMSRRRGGDLSGGQQQQLALARALIIEPELLIMDEPTEGIQPNVVAEIGEVIQQLNVEQDITVILVEQKLSFAKRVGSHYLLLDRGRRVSSGYICDLTNEIVNEYLTV